MGATDARCGTLIAGLRSAILLEVLWMAKGKARRAGKGSQDAMRSRTAEVALPTEPVERATVNGVTPGPGERHRLIAEAAYYRAERRGFRDGDPVADWLEAEAELVVRLGRSPTARNGRS
jgi:hypothetical protein